MLAMFWLRRAGHGFSAPDASFPLTGLRLAALRVPAAILFVTLGLQLILLTATFSGATSVHAIMAAMPDVMTTHSGKVAEYTVFAALVLWSFTLLRLKPAAQLAGSAALLLGVILLRSATGHSAVDGDFSLSEFLQVLHLSSMALWSGGILISGLIVVPGFLALGERGGLPTLHSYVSSLSTVSTYAVAAVALSGVVKSWRAVGGDLHQMRGNLWSYILIAKIVAVSVAIALGGLNRLHLAKAGGWDEAEERRAGTMLMAEACVMVAVLMLSAWLANMAPPGE